MTQNQDSQIKMPQIEDGPKGLNRLLESAYGSAMSSGASKESASKIAWASAKNKYKKRGENWVRKLYDDLNVVILASQKVVNESPKHTLAKNVDYLIFAIDKMSKFMQEDSLGKIDDVEWLDMNEVLTNPYNREVDRNKVDGIKQTVQETNSVKPVVYSEVDKDGKTANMITDGHHRYVALKELGYTQIPARLSDENGTDTTVEDNSVRLKKEIATADVQGLELVRQDLAGKPKKPSKKLEDVKKGAEGSGSWDGPGQPRFAHAGNKEFKEPFHSPNHVKQFLQSNDVMIGSVDRKELSPEKNALRQKEFETYLQDKNIPYKEAQGNYQGDSEKSYIIHTKEKEQASQLHDMLSRKYKQESVVHVRNGHATLQYQNGKVYHANINDLKGGNLTSDYTEVDGHRFQIPFKF